LSDGPDNCSRVCFSDVPASDPLIPALPSRPIATFSSCIAPFAPSTGDWKLEKTAPAIFSESATSRISTLEAFATFASSSVTNFTSWPFSLNVFSALEAISAASALLICAAADRTSTSRTPAIVSLIDRPALTISVIASAASCAEVPGSLTSAPSFCDSDESFFIWSPVACDTDRSVAICCSNVAADFTAAAPIAPTPRATNPAARAVFWNDEWLRLCAAAILSVDEAVDLAAVSRRASCAIAACVPVVLTRMDRTAAGVI
jgi:hypothetical protein